MSNGTITAQVTGGQARVIEASTVEEAMAALNISGSYSATVNGNPASLSDELADYSFVTFSPSVKGGC